MSNILSKLAAKLVSKFERVKQDIAEWDGDMVVRSNAGDYIFTYSVKKLESKVDNVPNVIMD